MRPWETPDQGPCVMSSRPHPFTNLLCNGSFAHNFTSVVHPEEKQLESRHIISSMFAEDTKCFE